MNTPHPELERLAALVDAEPETGAGVDTEAGNAANAAAPLDTSDLREHLAGCAQCAADLAALRALRATLRALPPVPMPDDVAQRLESALRAAAAEGAAAVSPAPDAPAPQPVAAAVSVLPARAASRRGARRGRSSGSPNFSVAAAVAVFMVLGLGVGLAVALSHGGEAKKSTGTSAASGVGSVVMASGTDYTQDTIRSRVADLVLARVPDAHTEYKGLAPLAAGGANAPTLAPAASSAAATSSAPATSSASDKSAATPSPTTASASSPTLSKREAFSGPLGDPARLQACVQALLDQPATPVLVDYAYYAGKPATIIVLKDPANPSTLDVYVEADTADCAKAGDVTFVAFLPNAS